MGWRYVRAVLDDWAHLPDRRFRLLLGMARWVLDEPQGDVPAGTYWGGHERLARMLRVPLPPGDSPEDKRSRAGALRHVRREVGELVKTDKAVEIVNTGQLVRQGHAQTYRLTFPPAPRAGPDWPSSAGPEKPSSAGPNWPGEQGQIGPPMSNEEESQQRRGRRQPVTGQRRRARQAKVVCSNGRPIVLDPDGSRSCCPEHDIP